MRPKHEIHPELVEGFGKMGEKSKKEILIHSYTLNLNRLRMGFNPKYYSGYHGYKIGKNKPILLYIWCFENLSILEVESVEAELVYLVRNKPGKWPLLKNEIHFHNVSKNLRLKAEEIFKNASFSKN